MYQNKNVMLEFLSFAGGAEIQSLCLSIYCYIFLHRDNLFSCIIHILLPFTISNVCAFTIWWIAQLHGCVSIKSYERFFIYISCVFHVSSIFSLSDLDEALSQLINCFSSFTATHTEHSTLFCFTSSLCFIWVCCCCWFLFFSSSFFPSFGIWCKL